MSGAMHTPGEWSPSLVPYTIAKDKHWYVVLDENENAIGEFYGSDHAENVANVHLAAAAPAMLAALEDAYAEIKAWRSGLNARNMNKCKVGATFADERNLRTAIAKAKGGAA